MKKFLCSILLILFIFNQMVFADELIKSIIESQKRIASKQAKLDRVAIGYNTCLDLIVSAKEVFNNLFENNENLEESDKASTSIKSLEDLRNTFAHFFKKGVAAERFVEDQQLFYKIIEAAERVLKKNYYIGGNAGNTKKKTQKS